MAKTIKEYKTGRGWKVIELTHCKGCGRKLNEDDSTHGRYCLPCFFNMPKGAPIIPQAPRKAR